MQSVLDVVAVVPPGLEEPAAAELLALGAEAVRPLRRAVACRTDLAGFYRLHLRARLPFRFLREVARFPCRGRNDLYRGIQAAAATPAATETPGSAIDRLSILELRRFHMREQLDRADATQEHREKAAARMAVLDAQRGHLIEAIDRLLTEIFLGQRPLRVFRMMKMYNDPTMNPYLYKAQNRAA